MEQSELGKVLSNWIREAISSMGKLPDGKTPSGWVTERFVEWLRKEIGDHLEDIEASSRLLREGLKNPRYRKKKQVENLLHELVLIDDHLADMSRNIEPILNLKNRLKESVTPISQIN